MVENGNTGIVYVLSNLAMPGYLKLGRTNNLERRMDDLYTTGVPLPFICRYASLVEHPALVEQALHYAFSQYRVSHNREFFAGIALSEPVGCLKMCEIEDATLASFYHYQYAGSIDNPELVPPYKTLSKIREARARRRRFGIRLNELINEI